MISTMSVTGVTRVAKYIVVSGLFGIGLVVNADFDHGAWTELLRSNVVPAEEGRFALVDYQAMQSEQDQLQYYLNRLSEVDKSEFAAWSKSDQLAFLLNAYNAWTVELVLGSYPDIDSIKDIGSLFRSPWSLSFIPLFGERVSLDFIEHELIRGSQGYNEPRIHFAVNCASMSCPMLRDEAYLGDRLEQQLEDATNRFLSDHSRNYFDDDTLRISRLFDWYRDDFETGWRGTFSVAEFLSLYPSALAMSDEDARQLKGNDIRIRYLRYDWDLNRTPE